MGSADTPHFTMAGRHPSKALAEAAARPGPGTYDPEQPGRAQRPGARIVAPVGRPRAAQDPGPGPAYRVPSVFEPVAPRRPPPAARRPPPARRVPSGRAPRRGRCLRGATASRSRRAPPSTTSESSPPLPTVAPTRVPTVLTSPPPSTTSKSPPPVTPPRLAHLRRAPQKLEDSRSPGPAAYAPQKPRAAPAWTMGEMKEPPACAPRPQTAPFRGTRQRAGTGAAGNAPARTGT